MEATEIDLKPRPVIYRVLVSILLFLGASSSMELKRIVATEGMVVTPHHLASQSALAILREGGTAMEAMVAAAATISVVYPHMNSIGGDSFWLIVPPHGDPICIDASGPAGSLATREFFNGYVKLPLQGPKSAITVAGTVAGWQKVLEYVVDSGYRRISLHKLLSDAIKYAESGYPISRSQVEVLQELERSGKLTDDIVKYYMPGGIIPEEGEIVRHPGLAKTLEHLSKNGLKSFYNGEVASWIAEDMNRLGMPMTENDFQNYTAEFRNPLKLSLKDGDVFNFPPPTQGLVSLAILGILDKLGVDKKSDTDLIHKAVEATKQAFIMRDQYITDPKYMTIDPQELLKWEKIEEMAANISNHSSDDGKGRGPGDTVWMGVMDKRGYSVSFIQSVYHYFGSGVVLPITGILWQNRGTSFSLDENNIRALEPGKKPFHTLNPAAARLKDGRVMVYGSQGGDGQPQFQSAIYQRYVVQGLTLQTSVNAPRWMYGMLTGQLENDLKIEDRFGEKVKKELQDLGHKVRVLPGLSSSFGQAGALVRYPDGRLEGAFDPRSDGSAVGY